MNKHVLALSTALSILAFTPAFAQNNAPAIDCTQQANMNDPACVNQQNNATQTQGQTGTTSTDQNAQSGTSTTTTTTDQNAQTTTQMGSTELIIPADQLNNAQVMSASDYIGKTVYDQAGNNIGDVNDLIVSGDGNIEAVILGVGGFLGMGEKDVAVNTQAVQMVQDGDNVRLVVQATKQALESAPSYDRTNRRYANQSTGTTTDTTGSTTAPAPAPAPANNNATGNSSGSGTVDCTVAANASDPACANQTQQQQ